MDRFVVVDLETTGQSPVKGAQIIEVGMVRIHRDKMIDQFSSYVKPDHDIPNFITSLTGITNEQVRDAPNFEEIAEYILDFIDEDDYFVAHHVEFDLGFLNDALKQHGFRTIENRIIDTVELARIFEPMAPGYKLSHLAEHMGIVHQNPHRALSDACVTAEIFIRLMKKVKTLPAETLEHLYRISGKLKSDLSFILSDLTDEKRFSLEERKDLEIYRGLAIKKYTRPLTTERPVPCTFGELLDDTFNEQGLLSTHLNQFEIRDGQRRMSEIIFDAFTQHTHAMIEAETGTGKTLAYLLSALYYAVYENTRVIISTYTTQLQSQIMDKEIPLLKKIFPIPFNAALLKGKRHYLSLNKFEQELQKPIDEDNYDVVLTKAMILVWLTETMTGDVDEIQLPSSGKIFWKKINAEADLHIDPKSPWFSKNFYQRAREQAQKADVIITNHALLCTDLTNDYPFLPPYRYAVIDEAHHLETSATKHFGLQVDYVSIQYLLSELVDLAENHRLTGTLEILEYIQMGKERADELFSYLYQFVLNSCEDHVTSNDVGRLQYVFQPQQIDCIHDILELTNRFLSSLKQIEKWLLKIMDQSFDDEQLQEAIEKKRDEIFSLMEHTENFMKYDGQKQVKWIEIEATGAKNAVYLYSEPISVAPLLRKHFFDQKESVVLTSATLTMNDSFTFMQNQFGLSEEQVMARKIPSPYRYDRQVKLMVPNDLPHIKYDSEKDFVEAVSQSIYQLAQLTQGRMLVLFTSYQMLKKTYYALKNMMMDLEFVLIAQGISSGSRSRLQKNFQAFEQAILFGTSSFWEGVDIPGDDLTSLVIVRLPFDPPGHPAYQARSAFLKEKGKNPFMNLALPHAVIRFKQGFGRLIRSSTDKGVVFVLDQRIISSRYGKYFIDSIPDVPVLKGSIQKLLQEVKDWL